MRSRDPECGEPCKEPRARHPSSPADLTPRPGAGALQGGQRPGEGDPTGPPAWAIPARAALADIEIWRNFLRCGERWNSSGTTPGISYSCWAMGFLFDKLAGAISSKPHVVAPVVLVAGLVCSAIGLLSDFDIDASLDAFLVAGGVRAARFPPPVHQHRHQHQPPPSHTHARCAYPPGSQVRRG